ncbi:helix-turn-helix domain-containing protein [Rhodococcus hoagii]|uniref:helix-turn-helix transcriptional regulator n=1 Tax=Rhodococcus hoagii TaxID=43767 RepID=UPI001962B434|nr:helix-turn-helix transcriptional regulator [Prescottella equi]MBM9838684.1 helix-turn-helix domain-containing protein [Prescottella equi]NKR65217.1 helix-turn-helix domain-containing protein [Prescottella equi]NKR80566.1 helix-turn-helix domain-containing protein [Prescottella equi]NKR80573.1 helix-turn-helix domain-containing protein [Prescottella equi]NKS99494.1 helix-turn-helix domain-containing protein [Prescottella equi]
MTGERPPETRRELGSFLRTRRERLTPDQVGLPDTRRRRTPGLRREEVAVLAGVGVTWYTWLEQGRPINVSTQVLTAVSRALRLDDTERRHLERLAGVRPQPVEAIALDASLAGTYQPVLDKLDPYPACLQTSTFGVVAYNRAYRFLFTDIDQIPLEERNCALQFFTDADWRRRYIDHDIVASRMVAQLRAVVGSTAGSTAAQTIGHLQQRSEEFAQLWDRHEVMLPHVETKRLDSPVVGLLQLNFVSTNVAETGHRLTIMTPADETTSNRLTQMSEHIAGLRI